MYEIALFDMGVPPCTTFKHFADFHEIWYEGYETENCLLISNNLQ